jgi:hypothetical protein
MSLAPSAWIKPREPALNPHLVGFPANLLVVDQNEPNASNPIAALVEV